MRKEWYMRRFLKLRFWCHLHQRWDTREKNHLRRDSRVALKQTGGAPLVWSHRLPAR